MRTHGSSIRSSLFCLCLLVNSASAASLVFTGSPGVGGNNVWSWASFAQQSYSSSLFAPLGPSIDITGISFYAWPNFNFQPGNSWTMTIGAVPNAVQNMNNVLTNNLPLANSEFFATESFTTDILPDRTLVTFHGHFVYTPADGDLVWQIQANGPIGGPAFYYGSSSSFGIYWYGNDSTIIQRGAHGYRGQLLDTVITIPETSTFILSFFAMSISAGGYMVRRKLRVRTQV